MTGGNTRAPSTAGAAVLEELYELVKRPPYRRVIEQCQLQGTTLSTGTINLLRTGKGSPRDRSVWTFVEACMELKPRKVVWPQGRGTAQGWIDAYNTACGRPPETDAGPRLVRVGVRPVPAEALQPRARLIDLLGNAIDEGKAAILTQPVSLPARVLSGLGGVGKSQLAAHYVGQQWEDPAIDVIVWAAATSTSGIVEAYAEAARCLFDDYGGDAEQNARRFLRWAATTPKRWLIVLDDLQTPGDLALWRPPMTATGQTVITTRYRGDAFNRNDVELIPVDVFTSEESRTYLHQRLDRYPHLLSESDTDAALDALAAELGYLPLALAQATAYMINDATPVDTYHALVTDQRQRLDDLVPDKDELPDGHQATIAATWSLSIQRANDTAPKRVAWPLLQIAALLDPAGIPEAVFAAEAITGYLTEAIGLDAPLDTYTIHRGLAVLHRYNLVTFDPTHPERAVTVHGLVQRATRDAVTAPIGTSPSPLPTPIDHADLAYATADALDDIWPPIDTTSHIGAILRANVTALIHHAGNNLWDPAAHVVLSRTGHSLSEAGQLVAAAAYFESLHSTAISRLGPDHPVTLGIRSDLAYTRGEAGDPAAAVTELEDLLEAMHRVLGPDDRDTLVARGNLAKMHRRAGDPASAAKEYEVVLEAMLRVLGPNHPDTFTTRNSIAMMHGHAGDPRGAVTELEDLLEAMQQALGPDHPSTLVARANLSHWRGEAGGAASEQTEREDQLADQLRILGPDHPNTLETRSRLAAIRGETGDLAGAVTEYEALLTDRLRVLGPDHLDTLATRAHLAHWRGETSDLIGTINMYEALIPDQLRVLGPDHPDTLNTRNNLAHSLGVAGDAAGAAEQLQILMTAGLRSDLPAAVVGQARRWARMGVNTFGLELRHAPNWVSHPIDQSHDELVQRLVHTPEGWPAIRAMLVEHRRVVETPEFQVSAGVLRDLNPENPRVGLIVQLFEDIAVYGLGTVIVEKDRRHSAQTALLDAVALLISGDTEAAQHVAQEIIEYTDSDTRDGYLEWLHDLHQSRPDLEGLSELIHSIRSVARGVG
jgi:hypothetical protein